MRQVGVLAAAGLVALEKMTERLAEDHVNAKLIADALASVPGISVDLAGVQTNIVILKLTGARSAIDVVAGLKRRGILCGNVGVDIVRLVTHHDLDRSQCKHAAEQIAAELAIA